MIKIFSKSITPPLIVYLLLPLFLLSCTSSKYVVLNAKGLESKQRHFAEHPNLTEECLDSLSACLYSNYSNEYKFHSLEIDTPATTLKACYHYYHNNSGEIGLAVKEAIITIDTACRIISIDTSTHFPTE